MRAELIYHDCVPVPRVLVCGILSTVAIWGQSAKGKDEFADSIRPVLAQNCAACHNPKSRVNFLKASSAEDIQQNRGLWRNVAAQLRNRIMPPLLMERYMEAAQQILDRAIVTPDLSKTFAMSRELAPGQDLSERVSIYVDSDYDIRVAVDRKEGMGTLTLKVDGAAGAPLVA